MRAQKKEMPVAMLLANRIIASLPTTERNDICQRCDLVDLKPGEVLAESGQPVRHIHFPVSAFISLSAMMDGSSALEVMLVGREGMQGVPLTLGVNASPWQAVVQGGGKALQMPADDFRTMLNVSPGLRRVLQRYVQVLLSQIAQTAVCACHHLVEERLARWMLMTHDRALSDTFYVTHEMLAELLGVRRAGVSTAASALQARNAIRYSRGRVTVIDRAELEAAACGCYAANETFYRAFLD